MLANPQPNQRNMGKRLHRRYASSTGASAVALLFGIGLIMDCLSSPGWSGEASRILRSLGQLNALSPAEGLQRIPVHTRATVTYSDPGWKLLFLQDATGSVLV